MVQKFYCSDVPWIFMGTANLDPSLCFVFYHSLSCYKDINSLLSPFQLLNPNYIYDGKLL